MTAREQRDKRFLDDPFLAEDRPPDLGSDPAETLDRRLDLVEDRRVLDIVHGPILEQRDPLAVMGRFGRRSDGRVASTS